jgi:hypothetical protein
MPNRRQFTLVIEDRKLFDQLLGFSREDILTRNRLLFFETVSIFDALIDPKRRTAARFLGISQEMLSLPLSSKLLHFVSQLHRVYIRENAILSIGIPHFFHSSVTFDTICIVVDEVLETLLVELFPRFAREFHLEPESEDPSKTNACDILAIIRSSPSLYSIIDPMNDHSDSSNSNTAVGDDLAIHKIDKDCHKEIEEYELKIDSNFNLETEQWLRKAGFSDMKNELYKIPEDSNRNTNISFMDLSDDEQGGIKGLKGFFKGILKFANLQKLKVEV